MGRIAFFILALGLASACSDSGSNPFDRPDQTPDDDAGDGTGDGTGDDGTPIDSDRTLPPGTASPSPDTSIFRREARGESGTGYAESVTYDAATDTFSVDNLAFDGDNAYTRDDQVGTLNGFAVYENNSSFPDPLTGNPVAQLDHKALYLVSPSGQSEVAIVRTGSYRDYGFGGFIYQRNGGVTLPATGQAIYTGNYAALRDFQGSGGIEYAQGDMNIQIDFDDFNQAGGVLGSVTNRRVFDTAGVDITDSILQALETENGVNYTALPTLLFVVTDAALDANGEITGTLDSTVATDNGPEIYESGNYYAVMSGDNAEEIAGVIVVTADDPRFDDVTVRETGGFLVNR